MANKKIIYPVTVEKLEKIKGDYIMLIGGRSTGKSYSVKYKMIRDAYNSIEGGVCMSKFIYLRRFLDEIKDIFTQSYFDDIPVKELTNGAYNMVTVYRHEIFLGNMNEETGKETREILIGRVCALSWNTKYKSQVFQNYKYIVYEEIIADSYINNETKALFNFNSTVFRNDKGTCFLIGNLISRFNPYYREWNLTNALTQEENTIDTYKIDNVVIKLWRCPNGVNNKMVFGHAKKAVDGVEYETEVKPHLPKDIEEYNILYTVVLKHNDFMYLCELLNDKQNNITWYVQPKTTPVQKNTRVITKDYAISPLWSNSFRALTEGERTAFDLIRAGKVCYSDNLTGTEFEQIIDEYL